jgi:hypothetical protein
MQENPPKILFLFIVILVVSGSFPAPVSAQSENDLTAAEQWVWDQIAAGVLVVDLQAQFPREEARVLSAAFLEDLLLNPPQTMARQGIHIEHAVFNQPLNLQHVEIPFELWLGHCQFEDKVDLSESSFQKDLSFEGSTFDREVNFAEIYVANDLVIGNGTTFANQANFRYAEIGANLQADNVQFSYSEKEAVRLRDMHVGRSIWLRNAIFNGQADFRYTQAGTNFNANDAKFNYAEGIAYFGEMKVGEFLFLNRAIFAGQVDFRFTEVGRSFQARDAQFNNKDKTAYFGNMKINVSLHMEGATFAGPVNFSYIEVVNNFSANGAQLNYDGNLLSNFASMRIGYSVLFNPIRLDDGGVKTVIFAGPVSFNDLNVGRSFFARGAQFKSTKTASFQRMNVDGAMLLDQVTYDEIPYQTIFEGPVDFRYTEVGINF